MESSEGFTEMDILSGFFTLVSGAFSPFPCGLSLVSIGVWTFYMEAQSCMWEYPKTEHFKREEEEGASPFKGF